MQQLTHQSVLRLAPVLAAPLMGCGATAPPRPAIDPALSPEQIVRALSGRKLTSRGTSSDGFGLEALKPFLRPLDLRRQAGGGQLIALSPTGVVFTFREANSSLHETRVYLPQKVACRGGAGTLWGLDARFDGTTFFPSAWAEKVFYHATIPLTFAAAAAFDRSDPNSPTNLVARAKDADDCQPIREQYTRRLRADPRVGMKVQFGVIIDVRLPMGPGAVRRDWSSHEGPRAGVDPSINTERGNELSSVNFPIL
jgi:hypothetical protein